MQGNSRARLGSFYSVSPLLRAGASETTKKKTASSNTMGDGKYVGIVRRESTFDGAADDELQVRERECGATAVRSRSMRSLRFTVRHGVRTWSSNPTNESNNERQETKEMAKERRARKKADPALGRFDSFLFGWSSSEQSPEQAATKERRAKKATRSKTPTNIILITTQQP